MEGQGMFNSLLIVILAAFIVPFITSNIRVIKMPVVIGEIIAGLILGVSGLNIIETGHLLEFLSAFGFTYLMFLSGLEIDFQALSLTLNLKGNRSGEANPLLLALSIFGLTIVLSFGIAIALNYVGLIKSPWLITLVLSTTSLGIVVPVLKEKEMINGPFGQSILLSALIADFLTMLLIAVVVLMLTKGQLHEIFLVLLLFLAFFVFYKLGNILNRQHIMKRLAHATSQIRVRGSFVLILIFVTLSEYLGSEAILGAFLAGTIVSLVSEKKDDSFISKLEAIGYGFFIPIFFIMVGAKFDLMEAATSGGFLILLPLLILALYLVKLIPAMLFRIYFSWQETFSAGFLLSSRLSLIIAASAVGVRLGEITENTNGAIIISAIVTVLVSPVVFEKLAPARAKVKKEVVIIGGTDNAILLGERLVKDGKNVTIVDLKAKQRAKAKVVGLNVVCADATTVEGFRAANIGPEKRIVVTTGTDEVNLKVCRIAKEIFGLKHIISVVNNATYLNDFHNLGVRAVNPSLSTLMVLENLVIHPTAFSLMVEGKEDLLFEEVYLYNQEFIGRPVKDIRVPGDTLIISISRNGEKIIPHGNTKLVTGDLIMLVGNKESVRKTMRMFRG